MKKAVTFTPDDVSHIAKLAAIPVTEKEKKRLAEGFNTTIAVVDELTNVNVADVSPIESISGLENMYREDVIDEKRILSQEDALKNAPRKHNGFFEVDQILDTG